MNSLVLTVASAIALSCLVSAQVANEYFLKENLKTDLDQCLKENSMTKEELDSNPDWTLETVPENHLCFHKCMSRKNGLLDENGMVVKDNVPDMIMSTSVFGSDENQKQKLVECILQIDGKIESCKDTIKLFSCFEKHGKKSQ